MKPLLFSVLGLLCFASTALILSKLIPYLKSKKLGQKILDIGPRWHKSKEGTPTMGGISFIASFLVFFIAGSLILYFAGDGVNTATFITVAFALLNGATGFLDDRTKFARDRNEGLKAWQKYLLQLVLTIAYMAALRLFGNVTTVLHIPFTGIDLDFGIWWYPFMAVLITGIVNSVNLADGIDGLAVSETAVVSAFFILASSLVYNPGSLLMSVLLLGGCLGFLVYNFYPARVFMGDTGSLFLGAAVMGIAIVSGNAIAVLVVGFMYVAESLSDIIQIGYFKLTHGKRIFKMAPIHHHFEKCGWSEIKIVAVFCAITLALSALTFIFDII